MAQARIPFTSNAYREDGSPLAAADIAAYRVERIPNAGGNWSFYSEVPAGSQIIVDVNSGDAHQYRVRTKDTGGRISTNPSNQVEVRFDAIPAPPAPPGAPALGTPVYL